MISTRDPQNDQEVTRMPCRIGTGDCEGMADGYCDECGKATCRSCAVELPSGLFHCLDCDDDLQTAKRKDAKADQASLPQAMALLASMEPCSACRPMLVEKIDEMKRSAANADALERAAKALAIPEMGEVPVTSGGGSLGLYAALIGMGCAAYAYAIVALAMRWE